MAWRRLYACVVYGAMVVDHENVVTSRLTRDIRLHLDLGTVRFTVSEGQIDAPQGSMMVVPPRAAHSFSNPSKTEEAEVYMTATPGMYNPISITSRR